MQLKTAFKKIWNFIWYNDSPWSWLANIIIAFILIKFIIYPLLGVILGTGFPIVAVMSESMEHGIYDQVICSHKPAEFKDSFENYWDQCGDWYEKESISESKFRSFPFQNGFYKGDMVFVWKPEPENINIGDVIIFEGNRPQPIIHRVVDRWKDNGVYYFQTKGDHNSDSITGSLGETSIHENRILGKGILKIPYLGWVKLAFVEAVKPFGIKITQ